MLCDPISLSLCSIIGLISRTDEFGCPPIVVLSGSFEPLWQDLRVAMPSRWAGIHVDKKLLDGVLVGPITRRFHVVATLNRERARTGDKVGQCLR